MNKKSSTLKLTFKSIIKVGVGFILTTIILILLLINK